MWEGIDVGMGWAPEMIDLYVSTDRKLQTQW